MSGANQQVGINSADGTKPVVPTTKGTENAIPTYLLDESGNQLDEFNKTVYAFQTALNSSNQIEYFGKALPGTATSSAGWSISKFTYHSDGTPATGTWASGTSEFDKIWDNRTEYTYV